MARSTFYIAKLSRFKNWCAYLCMIGLLLTSYAFYVEIQKERNTDYVAMCDINEYISCSKAFTSKYGKGFGFLHLIFGQESIWVQPNSVYGAVFYAAVFVLSLCNYFSIIKAQIALCAAANLGSVYLGYILYFILQDACVICIGTYIVNFLLLLIALKRLSTLKQLHSETGGPIIMGGSYYSKKRT